MLVNTPPIVGELVILFGEKMIRLKCRNIEKREDTISINNTHVQLLIDFSRTLSRANLDGEDYLAAEEWLILARELESKMLS